MQHNLFQKIKIKEVIEHIVDNRGRNPSYYVNKGIPVIDNFQITGAKFVDLKSSRRFIDESVFNTFIRKSLNHGDVLITLVGNGFGNVSIAPKEKSVIIQNTIGIRCNKRCLNNFLFYYLSANKDRIKDRNRGSAQPSIKVSDLTDIDLFLPPILHQQKIASILSAYDDLIENNNKRIKVLEQIAESIYREWFVNFKFPGNNGTRPQEWIDISFGNLAEFINGYAFKPYQLTSHGYPIIKIPELRDGVIDKTPRNSGEEIEKKYHVFDGDILFSWSATLLVNFWHGEEGLLNQHLFKVVPKDTKSKHYLFMALSDSIVTFTSHTTGATMKHIRRSALDNVKIPKPSTDILENFEKIISPIYRQVGLLNQKNILLNKTKNILLPKLISGELDVENLDIKIRPEIL